MRIIFKCNYDTRIMEYDHYHYIWMFTHSRCNDELFLYDNWIPKAYYVIDCCYHFNYKPSEKYIIEELIKVSNSKGEATVGYSYIADNLRLSTATIKKYLKKLEIDGVIRIVKNGNGKFDTIILTCLNK